MQRRGQLTAGAHLLASTLVACGGLAIPMSTDDAGLDGSSDVSVSGSDSGAADSGSSSDAADSGSSTDAAASGSSGGTSSSGGDGGVLPPCGLAGESCCGTSCNAGDVCVVIGGASQCEACGQPGQLCCTTMPACADPADGCRFSGSLEYCMNDSTGTLGQPGDTCTTTCVDPADTCVSNGMSAYCVACGLGNPCSGP